MREPRLSSHSQILMHESILINNDALIMPDMRRFELLHEDNDLSRYFTYLFTIKHRDNNKSSKQQLLVAGCVGRLKCRYPPVCLAKQTIGILLFSLPTTPIRRKKVAYE